MQKEQAETIAINALQHIATSPELLVQFLDLSGLTPATLRQAASDPAFLGSALEFLRNNEAESAAFAANFQLSPHQMEQATHALTGSSANHAL